MKKTIAKKQPIYIIPQYGLGSWLQDNAGTIGTVAGAALGSIVPGVGTAIGATLGGSIGGMIQGNAAQKDAQEQQVAQANQQQQAAAKQVALNNYLAANQNLPSAQYGNQFACGGKVYGNGGQIRINPANKGKFNATKARTGKTTEELTHSKNPLTRKRAIFAQNAAKWHHATGGPLPTSTGIDGMTVYGNGGAHETNPVGGVKIGNKGLVEQGEVRVGNYIFSNRLK